MKVKSLSIEGATNADWLVQRGFWRCDPCDSDGGTEVPMTNTDTGESMGTAYWGPQTCEDPEYPDYLGRAWCSKCGEELRRV